MKRCITTDEWYPVYVLSEGDDCDYPWVIQDLEIDPSLIDRYDKCLYEFGLIQTELQNLEESNGRTANP